MDAAEEAISGAQRELQEERERSARLLEAAQAGQASAQMSGAGPWARPVVLASHSPAAHAQSMLLLGSP